VGAGGRRAFAAWRIASPAEAAALVESVREDARAVWATTLYAGLRLGEPLAPRDEDVDLALGVIRVERLWDPHEGIIEPKSRARRRSVPIVATRCVPISRRGKLRRRGPGSFFFGDRDRFNRNALLNRANRACAIQALHHPTAERFHVPLKVSRSVRSCSTLRPLAQRRRATAPRIPLNHAGSEA
jgi:integrase